MDCWNPAENVGSHEGDPLEAVDEPESEFIFVEQGRLVPREGGDVDGHRSVHVLGRAEVAARHGGIVGLLIGLRVRAVLLELGEERVQEEDVAADLRDARARGRARPEDPLEQISGAVRDAELGLEVVLLLEEAAVAGVVKCGRLPGVKATRDEVDQDETQSPYICVLGPVWPRRCLLADTFCRGG